jgi:proteasome lid subunit RPN8/RPN11
MAFRLQVPRNIHDAILAQAVAELPNECCGLLAGRIVGGLGQVVEHYPLINTLASPREFESEPRSLFAAMRGMRSHGHEVLAVYHSHPTSPPIPSRIDIERNVYGDCAISLIVSLAGDRPTMRAWWLTETDSREGTWELMEESSPDDGG